MIQRSLASKNEQVAVSSSLIAGFAYLMLAIVPLTIGFAGRIIFPNFSIEHAEYVLPMVAQSMLSPVFFTIFLSALIAAIMSSADSSLLACSSLIVNNIIKPFSQERNQQKQLILTRWITCIIWGCSTLLALYAESIYTLMTNCWASQLVIVFIPVVAALYLKRSTKRSCWICMTASTVVWIGYVIIAGHLDEDTFTIGAVYGFATGIVAFLASHLSEKISRTGNIGSLIVGVLFGAFFEFIALVTDKMLPRLSFWAILTGAAAYGITLIFTYWGERLLNYYVHHEASETQHFRSNNNRDEYKPARRRSRRNYYDKNA